MSNMTSGISCTARNTNKVETRGAAYNSGGAYRPPPNLPPVFWMFEYCFLVKQLKTIMHGCKRARIIG